MQPLSLNLAAFNPGQLPPLLPRPRLLDKLKRQPRQGVILIQGQAAQGKTALVADFLRSSASKVIWVTLDSTNGDADNFFRLITGQLLPETDAAVPKNKPLRVGRTKSAPAKADVLRKRLKQSAADDIVLDSLEYLADSEAARSLLGELCRLCAANCRLWLISRRMAIFKPLLDSLGRRMLLLNNEDLAFTPTEVERYFTVLQGMPQSPARINHIHALTDGWCGGLVLLSQAMRNHPGDWDAPETDPRQVSRLTGEVFRYFQDEIHAGLPDLQRALLLQLCLPDTIDPPFLSRLPELQDLATRVENLADNPGFIRTFVDVSTRRTLYRFNTLFRDFLRTRFAHEWSVAEQYDMHKRLGRLYDSQGDLTTAVRHWIKGGDFKNAADGLRKIGVDLVIKGQLASLERWIEQMPATWTQSEPWLFLLLTLARRVKGQARSLEDFQRIWTQLSKEKDIRGQMITAAFLIEALVFQARPANECLDWIRTGEHLLSLHGEIPYYAWAKLLLWQQIGFCQIACGLNLTKGLSAARNALLLARKMGNAPLIRQAAIICGLGLIAGGDYQKARDVLDEPAAAPDGSLLPMYDILEQLARAQIDLSRGDDCAAAIKIRTAGASIERNGLVFLYPSYVEATGYLQLTQKKYDEALQTGYHLMDVSVLAGNPFYKALAHKLCGSIYYWRQKHTQAAAEADLALDILDLHGPETLFAMRIHQLRAIALMHLDQHDQAMQSLTRTLDYFKTSGNSIALAETYVMLGLVHNACRALDASREKVQQGFTLAARGEWLPFIVLSPDDQGKAYALAHHPFPDPGPGRSVSGPDLIPITAGAAAQGSTATVFSAVDWRNAAPGWLDVHTLGRFTVLRDGKVPISDRQWGGSKPKLLFKALLVHGLREIPRDIVIDNLWPESSPHAANQNFKVTLHRLRKILEPDSRQNRRTSLIQLKDNLLSLDKRRCRVDVEEFLKCCKEIKQHAVNTDPGSIAFLGNRVMELYQGDFLPEEPYAPWIEMKRWALRDNFMEAMLKASQLFFEQDLLQAAIDCCHAAIQIDLLQERIVRQLILIYGRCGRYRDALDIFEQHRSALKRELNVEPDRQTLDLLASIRKEMKQAD